MVDVNLDRVAATFAGDAPFEPPTEANVLDPRQEGVARTRRASAGAATGAWWGGLVAGLARGTVVAGVRLLGLDTMDVRSVLPSLRLARAGHGADRLDAGPRAGCRRRADRRGLCRLVAALGGIGAPTGCGRRWSGCGAWPPCWPVRKRRSAAAPPCPPRTRRCWATSLRPDRRPWPARWATAGWFRRDSRPAPGAGWIRAAMPRPPETSGSTCSRDIAALNDLAAQPWADRPAAACRRCPASARPCWRCCGTGWPWMPASPRPRRWWR